MTSEVQEIGGYAILDVLRQRAFSVTYRAERLDLGRTALIRTLKPTVSVSSPFAALLEREAMVLARLSHEAIVRLLDFKKTKEAIWIVLEDVRGVSLEEVIRAGKVEIDPAAAIMLEIARGAGHAHERGVVLNALRAAGVVVTKEGGIKLIDLSAAELPGGLRDDAGEAPPEPVEAGESFADPGAMAPEQLLGETAGARSDVWALGVLFHELLTAEKPFDAADRQASAHRIRIAAPRPLPAGVPRSIERVIARCLAKAPEDRYEDARAVASALEEALAERTRLPSRVLISRALAAKRLGEELAAPPLAGAVERPASPLGPDVGRALQRLAAVFGLIAVGAAAIQLLADSEPLSQEGAVTDGGAMPLGDRDRGSLRVVARPWAEVYIDGELVDVTPIGRPILVPAGRHFVTFRHPYAPDEQRTIRIAAGQSVLLDVNMRVERGDAGKPAGGADAEASP